MIHRRRASWNQVATNFTPIDSPSSSLLGISRFFFFFDSLGECSSVLPRSTRHSERKKKKKEIGQTCSERCLSDKRDGKEGDTGNVSPRFEREFWTSGFFLVHCKRTLKSSPRSSWFLAPRLRVPISGEQTPRGLNNEFERGSSGKTYRDSLSVSLTRSVLRCLPFFFFPHL